PDAGDARAAGDAAPAEAAPADGGPADGDGAHADDGTPLGLVLRLFGEALGLPDIEPDESFFELGGDSLIATRVLARIREVYPVDIKMRSLFASATAADLAALIESRLADPDRARDTDEEPS
ncbi:acyl carrier protein, partial [Streptomyces sp. NPDC052644]